MPYAFYTKMSREDVNAIRDYLATVEPVHSPVTSNQLPFPFNIRLAMRAWDLLFFDDERYKADPNKSAEWNRGAFLVTGPGHCGACHTPKNLLGADKTSEALQGSQVQGWFAPNITNDKVKGLGSMSVEEIAALLETGHNRIATVTGPMAEEIDDASSHFNDRDLKAIAVYLKSLPGSDNKETPVAESDARMQAGKTIFRDTCSACHGTRWQRRSQFISGPGASAVGAFGRSDQRDPGGIARRSQRGDEERADGAGDAVFWLAA